MTDWRAGYEQGRRDARRTAWKTVAILLAAFTLVRPELMFEAALWLVGIDAG